tara:strand:- start:283 stop:612 length:330 start_codon:yes stop_codon:yes gene_type:complete
MNDQAEFDFITNSTATITDTTTDLNRITIGPDSYGDYLTTGTDGSGIYAYSDEKQDAFKSINDRLKTIEQRLGVLVPDEKLLEQYELLQSLYNQYTAAEALLYDGENNE